MLIDSIYVYLFVDPDWGLRYSSKKRGAAEKEGIYFEIRDIDTSAHLHWGLKKIHAKPVWIFIVLLVTIRVALKVLLTCTFIPWLLNSFDLPSKRDDTY